MIELDTVGTRDRTPSQHKIPKSLNILTAIDEDEEEKKTFFR